MSQSTSTTNTELCICCGQAISNREFAQLQRKEIDGDPMRVDCIDSQIKNTPKLQSAFDAIGEALNSKNQAIWEAGDFEDKFMYFLKLRQSGKLQAMTPSGAPEGLAFHNLVQRAALAIGEELLSESDADTEEPEDC